MLVQFGTLGSGNHFFEVCARRARDGLGHAPLRIPRHRQSAREHTSRRRRPREGAGPRSRIPTWRTSRSAPRQFDEYIRAMLWSPGLRVGQPRRDDGRRAGRLLRLTRYGLEVSPHELPPQFRRRERTTDAPVDHAEGRHQAPAWTTGPDPGLMGRRALRDPGPGTRSRTTPARTAPGAACPVPRPASSIDARRAAAAMQGRTSAAGSAERLSTSPRGLQGRRTGHARPGRPGRV